MDSFVEAQKDIKTHELAGVRHSA